MITLKQIADDAQVPLLTAYHALRALPTVDPETQQRVQAVAAAHGYTLHITIRDVAALAGVSVGTVSHVLNNSPLTKPETRQRVLQAIHDLDYRRNSIARGLKSNQSRLIGYAWHSAEDPVRRNALLDRFLYDIAQAAEAWGYHILTFAQHPDSSVESYIELIQSARVDGFVLSDLVYDDPRVRYLQKVGIPFVSFGRIDSEVTFSSVEVDSHLGMRLVIEHLLELGHRQIALLSWPAGQRVGDERVRGYYEALTCAGITPPDAWIARTPNTVEQAMLATQQVLAAQPRPTAIACTNDVMAFGVMRYLSQLGLQPGVDIAVTGYDDTPVAELLGLTSVRQPTDLVAHKLVEMLLAEIQGEAPPERSIVLEPSVVARFSTTGHGRE
jgi:DNA-binding LacI/PurR family transcriptional regulator